MTCSLSIPRFLWAVVFGFPVSSLHAQTVLLNAEHGNGSFEVLNPHSAPITGPVNGRRAINSGGSFEIPGWEIRWIAGYVGIDPTRNAHHGESYAFVNTASAMEMTSDTVDVSSLDLEVGDLLELSFLLAGEQNGMDVKISPTFVIDDIEHTLPPLSLFTPTANQFQTIQFAHPLTSAPSEVKLKLLLDNTGTGSDQPRIDSLTLRAIPEEQLPNLPQPIAELFVAPDGDDSHPGTFEEPLATLTGARSRIREFNPLSGLPEGGTVVNFRGGNYYLNQMTVFDGLDSGQPGRPITYRSFPGEEARFMGGLLLEPDDYMEVTSDDPAWPRIDPLARGQVLSMDLSPYELSDFGEPNANQTSHQLVELSFNEEIMELGRWPNDGKHEVTRSPRGDDFFTYLGDRPERWANAPDPYVRGQFSTGYFSEIIPIREIDTTNRTIHLTENPSGRGAGHNKAWSAFNLLEEIDQPGEYYLDRANQVLYFWPPSDVAVGESLLSTYGAPGQHAFDIRGAAHLRFENLTFELFNDRISRVWSSDQVIFDGCTFRNSGEIGLSISNSTDLTIQNCQFEALGATGLLVASNGDRSQLLPANIQLLNNHFLGTGRWKTGLTYAPPVWVSQVCGLRIAHNRFENTKHVGLCIFNSNLTTVETNRFFRCATEADDCAAIYTVGWWGGLQGSVFRHNEFREISRTNLPGHYGGHGVRALYFDFGASGALTEGNIAYKVDDRVWLNNWARDVEYKNNITARSGPVYWAIDAPADRSCELLEDIAPFNAHLPGSAWHEAFPHLRQIPTDCNAPSFAQFRHTFGKVSSDLTWLSGTYTAGSGIPYYEFAPGSLQNVDPKFYDEENCCLALQEDSPAYDIPGFQRIPWELIGRLDLDQPTRPVPPDGFTHFVREPSALYWAPVFEASFHRVYLSTDQAEVLNRLPTALKGEVQGSAFTPGSLEDTTYYWSVDAYDEDGGLIGEGELWQFTVGNSVPGSGPTLSVDPIAYWPFDNTSGTRAHELISGNDALGSRMEGDEWLPSLSGNALDLDGNFVNGARPNYFGSGESMNTSSGSNQGDGAGALTLSLWINPDIDHDGRAFPNTRGYYGVMGTAEGSLQYWALNFFYDTVSQTNGIDFRGHGGGLSVTGNVVNAESGWHHLAGVWTGSQKVLYLDGNEIARQPVTGPAVDVSTWQFGRDRNLAERYFDGQLAEAAIFTTALPPEEIALIHSSGREGVPLLHLIPSFDRIDTDQDGTSNALERFLGNDPYSSNPSNHLELLPNGDETLTLTFPRSKNLPDDLPEIEVTTDLINWTSVSNPSITVSPIAPTQDLVHATFSTASPTKVFVRIRVKRQSN